MNVQPEGPVEIELCRIIDELKDLLLKKHRDYGTKNLDEFGSFGIFIRVTDKRNRLANLIKRPDGEQSGEVGESLEDTWLDIAGYAIQAVRYTRKGE